MTLPILDKSKNETENLSVSTRKKQILNDARADALRANLKKRKDQTSARKNNTKNDIKQEETTNK